MRCRTKETFYCFHFKGAEYLPELKKFLGSHYVVEPIIYPSGSVSDRQYKIQSKGGVISTEKIINFNDWILLWVLGIYGIYSDHVFRSEFDIIREKKPK